MTPLHPRWVPTEAATGGGGGGGGKERGSVGMSLHRRRGGQLLNMA